MLRRLGFIAGKPACSRQVASRTAPHKTRAIGQLSGGHGGELVPMRHLAQPATSMVLVCQRLQLMSRDKFQHLLEHRIMTGYSLNLLVVMRFCHTLIVTTR